MLFDVKNRDKNWKTIYFFKIAKFPKVYSLSRLKYEVINIIFIGITRKKLYLSILYILNMYE